MAFLRLPLLYQSLKLRRPYYPPSICIFTRNISSKYTAREIRKVGDHICLTDRFNKVDSEMILELAKKAAVQGNNVGLDEYDHLKLAKLLQDGHLFQISSSDKPIGFLILHPSPYSRRIIPLVGCITVILTRDVMGKDDNTKADMENDDKTRDDMGEHNEPKDDWSMGDMGKAKPKENMGIRKDDKSRDQRDEVHRGDMMVLYAELVELSVRLTIEQSRGYLGVMTGVFTSCTTWYQILRDRAFLPTAILPSAGHVTRFGTVNSYLMYRQFDDKEIQGKITDKDDLIKAAEMRCMDLPDPNTDATPLKIPQYLISKPSMTFSFDQNKIICRPAVKTDGPLLYERIQLSLNYGFGEGQFPTYKYFYHTRFTKMEFSVFTKLDGEIMFALGTEKTALTRSICTKLDHGMLIVNPKFATKGLLYKLSSFTFPIRCMLSPCGVGVLDHTLTRNTPVIQLMKRGGSVFVGNIPASDLIRGRPIDCVINYRLFLEKDKTEFAQIVKK